MRWDQYRSVMEKYAIKTDDMATEDAYFMATHMPFSQLEVFEGGQTERTPELMSEDAVFENLVCNPDNLHRMIIVRGNNGTGKSHLIRYLKARLENSPSTIYNPETEQLIFLRRLNNSIRGAFSQLLEQKVIKDLDVEEKIKKFVDSSESKDEASFKTDILFSYIAAVSSDKSGETYKPVICRNLAQFLSDSRVQEHLMREDGAISRCYRVITTPSDQVLKDTTVFTIEDFDFPKMLRAVISSGNLEANDFATMLKDDDEEIAKLVNYMNRFTRDVVQRCADISSESTKSVFEQLRKDLKKQGKNLTLFIEDFTGFTGIDSELITVLSTEHGGDYEYLCRVTAIIGITDGYYDQFRDNFKDRVTHQISVTEKSYGDRNFLLNMAARYLNAVYCDPEKIREWYAHGAVLKDLPISDFEPPCPWESASIGEKEATLYPFNGKALVDLYNSLPVKTPRMFLKEVIRAQLKEYFNGKKYQTEWQFPMNPGAVQMSIATHSSAIDRLENLSIEDRQRLKNVFALWGDGSANGIKLADGTVSFGGINRAFLDDIGLASFTGIGKIQEVEPNGNQDTVEQPPEIEPAPVSTDEPAGKIVPTSPPAKEDSATKSYRRWKSDIEAWFAFSQNLTYHPDYRTWLKNFLCGSNNNCGAINWQDIGIPAYIAAERLSDTSAFYIEGQSDLSSKNKALVIMDRSAESRDALLALMENHYARGWDFPGAAFYQQKLITWLERRKTSIIENVCAAPDYQRRLPIAEWCLALQYLKAMILGKPIDTSTALNAVKSLLVPIKKDDSITRVTQEWNSIISFVGNEGATFDSALELLQMSANTTMGTILKSKDSKVFVYHTDELVTAAEKLIACGWDIENELPDGPDKNLLYNPANLLKKLYPKIKQIVVAEEREFSQTCAKLTEYVGALNQDNLIEILSSIQNLFSVFYQNGMPGNSKLREKYETAPINRAKSILSTLSQLKCEGTATPVSQLAVYSANGIAVLTEFLHDLQEIERIAQVEQQKAERQLTGTTGNSQLDALAQAAADEMVQLCDQLKAMEVQYAD